MNTYQCKSKIRRPLLAENWGTASCWQVEILGPKQHGMAKLEYYFLSYQIVSTHSQLFCMSQSASANRNLRGGKWNEKWNRFSILNFQICTLLQKTMVFETGFSSTSCRRANLLLRNAVSEVFSALSSPLQSTRTWTCATWSAISANSLNHILFLLFSFFFFFISSWIVQRGPSSVLPEMN